MTELARRTANPSRSPSRNAQLALSSLTSCPISFRWPARNCARCSPSGFTWRAAVPRAGTAISRQVSSTLPPPARSAATIRQSDFRVVAAIDFGTHSTGYAWVPVDEHNDAPARREIKVHTEWPDQPVRGAKTLSAILLAADHAVEAWGYTARQRRGSRSATTPDRYHHAFKLDLYGVRPGHHQDALRARSPLTPAEAAVVTAAFLRQIVQEAVREIKASGYQEDAIRWCLTVPAIWDDQAMSLTRQAAVQAGLPDDPDRLCLVREPEAAALHCLVRGAYVVDSRREPAITKLPRGARYMIVDCGGGTIDISAYEVDGYRRLRQIGKMFGGTFGSEFLNRAFLTEVLYIGRA